MKEENLGQCNIQKNKVENIIRKHWNILLRNNLLGGILPPCPSFVYKKTLNLRHILAPGVLDPPVRGIGTLKPFLTGFYSCWSCMACKTTKGSNVKREFTATATERLHKIKEFITCTSEGVVYVLDCHCKFQYVVHTSRPLLVRVCKHINNIIKGVKEHNVSKPFREVHNSNPNGLKLWGWKRSIITGEGVTSSDLLVMASHSGFMRPRYWFPGVLTQILI